MCFSLYRLVSALTGFLVFTGLLWGGSTTLNAQEAILGIKSTHQIRPDGAVESLEEIKVRAESNLFKNGLDVRFPLSLKSPFGGRVRRKISAVSVSMDGAPEAISLSQFGGALRLRSGGDRILKPGEYVFEIRYLSEGQLKFRDGEEEIIVPVVPYDWQVPVQDASVEILLPGDKIATRIFAATGDINSRTGSIIVRKTDSNAVKVQTSKSLARGSGMTVAVAWGAGAVQRPTAMGQLRETLNEYRHMLLWLGGAGVLATLTMLARLRGKERGRKAQFETPNELSPASVQYLQDGRVNHTTIAVQILGLATKGYLTVEETENQEFLLQRTWRESDLGLTPCDHAVAKAFYENRPTRFLVTPHGAPELALAKQNLTQAIAYEVERAHWLTHRIFTALFWLFALGISVVAVLLSPAGFWTIIAPILMLLGGGLLYRTAMKYDLAWHSRHEARNWFYLLLRSTKSKLGIAGLALIALGFIILLFGSGFLEASAALAYVCTAFLLHRICVGPQHFGVGRDTTLAKIRNFIVEPPETGPVFEINQPIYEQFLPYAAAWGLNIVWARRFARATSEMGVAPQRPRWLATPRPTHDPEDVSTLIFDRLRDALEWAATTREIKP